MLSEDLSLRDMRRKIQLYLLVPYHEMLKLNILSGIHSRADGSSLNDILHIDVIACDHVSFRLNLVGVTTFSPESLPGFWESRKYFGPIKCPLTIWLLFMTHTWV